MSARKIATWRVVFEMDGEPSEQLCINAAEILGAFRRYEPERQTRYICPHCSKAWPMHHRERESPLKHSEYRRLVYAKAIDYGNTQRYCCPATQRDCEDRSDDDEQR
jgi:hypothetical protein